MVSNLIMNGQCSENLFLRCFFGNQNPCFLRNVVIYEESPKSYYNLAEQCYCTGSYTVSKKKHILWERKEELSFVSILGNFDVGKVYFLYTAFYKSLPFLYINYLGRWSCFIDSSKFVSQLSKAIQHLTFPSRARLYVLVINTDF